MCPMKLTEKVKTALDETSILIMGAQILLGFQLRGVFADAFDELPSLDQSLFAVALGLLIIVVGLLIMPGPYHRMVERGSDSGRLHDLVSLVADLALFPFALALGLGIFIAGERMFGAVIGAVAGGGWTGLALALWYGIPRWRRRSRGARERQMTERQRDERPETPLHVRIEQMLTEARVILPAGRAGDFRVSALGGVDPGFREIAGHLAYHPRAQPRVCCAGCGAADGAGRLSPPRLCR